MQAPATSPPPTAPPAQDHQVPPQGQPEHRHKSHPTTNPPSPTPHPHNWLIDRWTRCTGQDRDRGMSTAEYAVGTIAACAFAALLFKVVSSPEVQEMLSSLIDKALKTAG
nr:DUF4244 domain-containing protein [Nonomuraea rhizosphaerae]